MKTTFTYGLGMAIAGALLNFAFYFLGYHDTIEKFAVAQKAGIFVGLAIVIVGLILAIRARRSETPADEDFGYGRALGAGALTSLWSAVFGTLFNLLYATVINTGMRDLIVESQLDAMAKKGMSSAQIDQAEPMIRTMTSPVIQSAFGLVIGFLFAFILSLIIAAFLRRPAADEVPPPIAA